MSFFKKDKKEIKDKVYIKAYDAEENILKFLNDSSNWSRKRVRVYCGIEGSESYCTGVIIDHSKLNICLYSGLPDYTFGNVPISRIKKIEVEIC